MPQPTFWQTKNLTACALWPLSLVYSAVSGVHLWARGLRPYYAGIPVISVGNINVGGVGKTPVVAYLAQHLAAQGHRVAILSRGYGGQYKRPHLVTETDTAADVGDEPKMLFNMFKTQSVDIWVSPNRRASASRAERSGATIILLDDGFQYRGLYRNLNIVVTDGTQRFGNGFTLPAGPLRESIHALKRADLLMTLNDTDLQFWYGMSALRLTTQLDETDIAALKNTPKPIHAFAGIGHPDKFFTALKKAGVALQKTTAFPDHHTYTDRDIKTTLRVMQSDTPVIKSDTYVSKPDTPISKSPQLLVTTEKDAVRLPKHVRNQLATVGLRLSGDALADLNEAVYNALR